VKGIGMGPPPQPAGGGERLGDGGVGLHGDPPAAGVHPQPVGHRPRGPLCVRGGSGIRGAQGPYV